MMQGITQKNENIITYTLIFRAEHTENKLSSRVKEIERSFRSLLCNS